MSAAIPSRAGTWRWCAALVLLLASFALAQTVSDPSPVLPTLPDADASDLEIPDLDEAPPLARDAIVKLALLGAYPLGPDMRAFPNRVLDHETAAFMLVNLFSLRLVEEFPVPPDVALTYLEVVIERQVAPDTPVTVGELRAYLLEFVGLTAVPPAEIGPVLDQRYPALAAGNLDAPITRAGASLMIVIALETILARTD